MGQRRSRHIRTLQCQIFRTSADHPDNAALVITTLFNGIIRDETLSWDDGRRQRFSDFDAAVDWLAEEEEPIEPWRLRGADLHGHSPDDCYPVPHQFPPQAGRRWSLNVLPSAPAQAAPGAATPDPYGSTPYGSGSLSTTKNCISAWPTSHPSDATPPSGSRLDILMKLLKTMEFHDDENTEQ